MDRYGVIYSILTDVFYPVHEFPPIEANYLSPIEILPTSGLNFFYIQMSILAILGFILLGLGKYVNKPDLAEKNGDWAFIVKFNIVAILLSFVFLIFSTEGDGGYIDLTCIPVVLQVVVYIFNPAALKEMSNISLINFLKNHLLYLKQMFVKIDIGSPKHHSNAIIYMAYSQLSSIFCYLVYGNEIFIDAIFLSALIASIGFFNFILKLIEKIPALRMGRYGYINIFIISISTVVYISFVSSVINDIYSISGSYFPNTILAMTTLGFSMIFHNLFSSVYVVGTTLGVLTFWIIPKNYIRKIISSDYKSTEYKVNNLTFKVSLVLFVFVMTLFSDHFESRYRKIITFFSYNHDFESKHSCSNFEIKNHEKLIELKDGRFYIFDINNEVAFIEECKRKEVIEINKG